MGKSSLLIIGVLVSLSISCKNTVDNKLPTKHKDVSSEKYLEHLNEIDSLLCDSLVKGWSAQCRLDDYNHYVLKYDTSSSANPQHLWEKYYYVDCFDIYTGESGCYNVVDTALLCGLWGIDKECYWDYVKNVCKAIREVLGGYKIDIVTFYRNNNVFFSSTDCGWNLFFVNNMAYMQDSNLYKDVLSSNGYRRLVGTKNWHLFQQKKQKETDN